MTNAYSCFSSSFSFTHFLTKGSIWTSHSNVKECDRKTESHPCLSSAMHKHTHYSFLIEVSVCVRACVFVSRWSCPSCLASVSPCVLADIPLHFTASIVIGFPTREKKQESWSFLSVPKDLCHMILTLLVGGLMERFFIQQVLCGLRVFPGTLIYKVNHGLNHCVVVRVRLKPPWSCSFRRNTHAEAVE